MKGNIWKSIFGT